MFEVIVRFTDYLITYRTTENAMVAQAQLTAWLTRYPHAAIAERLERRHVKHDHGETLRAVQIVTLSVSETVPEDLRRSDSAAYW